MNDSRSNQFQFAGIAAEIAREAGALLRAFYDQGVAAEYKGAVDIVTEADRASEALIRQRLTEHFPDHGICGEEGTRQKMNAAFRWYVDPLDGTTNFAHGFPSFCVVLGLEQRGPELAPEEDGVLAAGVIFDPLRDELFVAERGRGAYRNGKRISVSQTGTLERSLLATGFPPRDLEQSPNIRAYHAINLRSHGVRRPGSAALDLAYVACGRLDGYWIFHLNPWDTAAGALLIEEAGGVITHVNGGRFKLDSHDVLATNGRIHGELLELFETMAAEGLLEPLKVDATSSFGAAHSCC